MAALEFYLHTLTTSLEDGECTKNYEDLKNKPQINGTELVGNKTAANLGLVTPSDVSNAITAFFNSKFVVLKQSEYDAIETKDPTVFYCIKEEAYKGSADPEPEGRA